MRKGLFFIFGAFAATCLGAEELSVSVRAFPVENRVIMPVERANMPTYLPVQTIRVSAHAIPVEKEEWIGLSNLPIEKDENWTTYFNGNAHWVISIEQAEGATKFEISDFSEVQYPFWIKKLKNVFYEHTQVPWDSDKIKFKIYDTDGDSVLYESDTLTAIKSSSTNLEYTECDLEGDSVKIETGNFWVAFVPLQGDQQPPTSLTDSGTVREHSFAGGSGAWQQLIVQGQDSANAEWPIHAYLSWVTPVEELPVTNPGFKVSYSRNPIQKYGSVVYEVPLKTHVSIKLYDITGRVIATLENRLRTEGKYEVKFDATELVSGIYFCKFQTPDFNSTRKLILLK